MASAIWGPKNSNYFKNANIYTIKKDKQQNTTTQKWPASISSNPLLITIVNARCVPDRGVPERFSFHDASHVFSVP
jgi:hypothetical protein